MSLRPDHREPTFRREHANADAGEATIGPGSQRKFQTVGVVDPSRAKVNSGSQPERSGDRSVRDAPTREPEVELGQRYQVQGELGRGGWGVVDRVVDRKLERSVALKRILDYTEGDEDLRDQFLHEARITSQLQHPGVVPVHELGDEDEAAYYVMKLLSGETLHAQIRQAHQEAAERSSRIEDWVHPLLERFLDVCRTVAYAHDQGILHRDLKPANIMVGGFGETIVLDWGLAKSIEEVQETESEYDATVRNGGETAPVSKRSSQSGQSQRRSECDGTVVGTPAYMSPEQARGEVKKLDARSDVFALGVILYEILAGAHPHSGKTTKEVLQRAAEAEYLPLKQHAPKTPRPLIAIVEAAMARDVDARYPDAEQLADDVQRWMLGQSVSAHPDTNFDRVARWCRRNRSIAGVIAISAMFLLVTSTTFAVVVRHAHRAETLARVEAESQREKAESAHRLALTRLSDARAAADEWLVELSGALQFYPGLSEHRKQLLQRAKDQYARLAAEETGENPEERLERARSLIRLGDAVRLSGEIQASREHYRAADAILRQQESAARDSQLVRNVSRSGSPSDLKTPLELERTHAAIGRLLAGETLDAEELSRHTRSLRTRLPFDETSAGEASQWQAASALARLQLASPPHRSRLEEAVRWSRWVAQTRSRPRDIQLLAVAHEALASHIEQQESPDEAIVAWAVAIRDLEKYSHAGFATERLQRSADSRIRRAALLAGRGRIDEAVSEYEQAIQELNQAWQSSDPQDFYRSHLVDAELGLGKLLAGGKRAEAARVYLERSLATSLELMREQPSVPLLRQTTQTHYLLGNLHADPAGKTAMLRRAAIGFEMLDDHDSLSPDEALQWLSALVDLALLSRSEPQAFADALSKIDAWRKREFQVEIAPSLGERIRELQTTAPTTSTESTEQSLPSVH